MKAQSTLLSLTALASGLFIATAASAHHVHRHGVVVAPHVAVVPAPRVVRPAALYCAAHGCAATSTTIGPHGGTITRSGSVSCAGGSCSRSGSITGPGGETATISRSISR